MITLVTDRGTAGTVDLRDGQLTGSTPGVQSVADAFLAKHGTPQRAYWALAMLSNGYVRAVENSGLATELAAIHGHHVPGTSFTYRHGWKRIEGGDTVRYHGNLGIERGDMPQLSGTVRGEYQGSAVMQPKFIEHLRRQGISVTHETADASQLQPTQTTGDIRVIKGIAGNIARGHRTKPIFVSSDDRVLDGHHTWAARQQAAEDTGRPELAQMDITRVDLPISELIEQAHEFGRVQGIERRATGQVANPKYTHRTSGLSLLGPDEPIRYFHNDSLGRHTLPDGSLDPERQALHNQIVARALAGHQREAHPVATFLGGGTAAGKSTKYPPGSIPGVHVDSDEIKRQLPEQPVMEAADDLRWASFLHEESSLISKKIKAAAEENGYSYTIDGTGDGSYDNMRAKIAAARAAGHVVVGKYVTLDTDEAIRRAKKRAEETGREIAPTIIRGIHAGVTETFRQLIANNDLDAVELWDNNGPSPTLIGRKELGGTWTVADQAAWQRFLAKEGGT